MESKGKEAPGGIEQLIVRLEKQEQEIAALKAERDGYRHIGPKITPEDTRSKIVRDDMPPAGGGYVVEIPKPWTGTRMDVQFRNGIGIVPADHPKAAELAHWFEADYHYRVTPATEEELNRVRRALEGAPIVGREITAAEKLLPTGRAGIVSG